MPNDALTPARANVPARTGLRPPDAARRAVALVVVLSFLVLITGVVLAFFSSSILQHQVSRSSASLTAAELFARGALNATVGDLQQEIVDGSNTPVPIPMPTGSYPVIYLPKTAANAEPALSGTSGATGTENVLKRSDHTAPFYTNGVKRAANSSTASTSINGRSVPLARWNKPLLLGITPTPVSPTDLTPVSAFAAPDWILVNNSGANPDGGTILKTLDSSMTWSNAASNQTAVVGRYAYTIYNEGGLLDANVAGYPAQTDPNSSTGANYVYKNAEAFADLTKLGLTQTQINALVGWRNNATMSASGALPTYSMDLSPTGGQATYLKFITGNTNGFLSTASTVAGSSSGTTDHQFATRQSLIQFLVNGVGQSGSVTSLQSALQYLGSFTRGVNAPTYTPSASRPKVVPSGTHPNDDDFNPSTINDARVSVAFTTPRYSDGTFPQIGEPLIKYRFPLSRLALFGNSDSAFGDTSSDIYKYFGLTRGQPSTSPPTPTSNAWTYNHGSSGKIMTLAQVAAAGREPDFFELLQAGMTFGSLGQTLNNTYCDDAAYDAYTYIQVLQTGANIMDQYDTDSFPTVISLNTSNGAYTVYGLECLPYICQIYNLVYRKDDTQQPRYYYQPTLWNPQNSASVIQGGPSTFRFISNATGTGLSIGFAEKDYTAYYFSASNNFSGSAGITFSPSPTNNFFQLPTFTTTKMGATAVGDDIVGDPAGSLGSYVGHPTVPNPTSGKPWQDALDGMQYTRVSHSLQYSRDSGKTWTTYDQVKNRFGQLGQNAYTNPGYRTPNWHQYQVLRSDPRCDRFGVVGSIDNYNCNTTDHPYPTTPRMDASTTGSTTFYSATAYQGGAGWTSVSPTSCYFGTLSDNLARSPTHYADPDGVIRPAFGAYTSAGGSLSSGGFPMADDSGTPAQFSIHNSRPVVLNRPFRSVADMGYASRGAPWKNVDFFHNSSGDAALLDLFCVDPTPASLQSGGYAGADLNMKQAAVPLRAGVLDLNTRQTPVIQAMLSGAIKQETFYSTADATQGASTPTTASDQINSDANTLASSLVALTAAAPLTNRGDLVTKWSSSLNYAMAKDSNIKSDRESATRALADVGNTRTWNLLIDLIAQTGRYPTNAGKLDQFNVEGERRYWLHVAIDRYTGKVVSQSLEPVYE